MPGVTVHQNPTPAYQSNYWLTCIQVDKEITGGVGVREIYLNLNDENIESRPLWKPLHLQPIFENAPFYGDGTSEAIFRQGLCLPSGPVLTDEDVERVVNVVKEVISNQ